MTLAHIVIIDDGLVGSIETFAQNDDIIDDRLCEIESAFEEAIKSINHGVSERKIKEALEKRYFRYKNKGVSLVSSTIENMQI